MTRHSLEEMIRVVFQSFSRGMDTPTQSDFEDSLLSLEVDFSASTMQHLFQRCDQNGDGRLSSSEFRYLGNQYPKLMECMYHRLGDRKVAESHTAAVQQAGEQLTSSLSTQDKMRDALQLAMDELQQAEEDLRSQSGLLDKERQKEAAARLSDESERHEVSTRQADQVASALGTAAKGVCAEKQVQQYAAISEQDIKEFVERISAEWRRKPGDVVDELITNLKAPETVHSKLAVIAEASRFLQQSKGDAYPRFNRIELLCMTLYTMAGPDIDALLTYDNVPTYDEQNPSLWENYVKQHSKERNGAIFSAINWAMRTAADPKKKDQKDGQEAWETCCKWVKYIGLLISICTQENGDAAKTLYRGLAGLPEEVLAAHRAMQVEDSLHWPSASSCAFDREVSESYIRGDAANATRNAGGAILFLVGSCRWGVALQEISKYPKEAELLLPPFAAFKIKEQATDGNLPNASLISMDCEGHNVPRGWVHEIGESSQRTAQRLQTALVAHAEGALKDRAADLEKQRQRERQSNADLLRTDREVDRQRARVQATETEAKRAEERLLELERLLEEQRNTCLKQQENVQRTHQEFKDAEELQFAATREKELADGEVKRAEAAVHDAEVTLDNVKKVKEQRRRETQQTLLDARRNTGAQERAKAEAANRVAKQQSALQDAKNNLEAAGADVSDTEKKLRQLQEESEELKKRRNALNDEERPILEQEIRLVEQRIALEEKEAKHHKDLNAFDEQWRPVSPIRGSPHRRASGPASASRGALRSQSPLEIPPPGNSSLRHTSPAPSHRGTNRATLPGERVCVVQLRDLETVGLFWEGRNDGEIVVKSVTPNGAAHRAGVAEGMQLLAVDGNPITSKEALQNAMKDLRIKGTSKLLFKDVFSTAGGTDLHTSPARSVMTTHTHLQSSPSIAPAAQPTIPPVNMSALSAVERIRQGIIGSSAPAVLTHSPVVGSPGREVAIIPPATNAGASSRDSSPIRSTAAVAYAPAQTAAVELARRERESTVLGGLSSPSVSSREPRAIVPLAPSEIRVGRPISVGRPAGRPTIAAHPRGVSPAPYNIHSNLTSSLSGPPPASIASALPVSAAAAPGLEGESLERRIARLSAEVAASRDRSQRPLK